MGVKEEEEKRDKLAKDLFTLNEAANILEARNGKSFSLKRECPTLYYEIGKILQELADSLREQPKSPPSSQ